MKVMKIYILEDVIFVISKRELTNNYKKSENIPYRIDCLLNSNNYSGFAHQSFPRSGAAKL